jgi:glyoxylase-like metal-dependent hydrolase (beta-lactamase superfamily II)
MPSARTIALAVAVALFLPLLLGLAAVKWVESQMPGPQGLRVRGPHDLVGVQTQGSYAWVVPTPTGVVVVDAGLDPKAAALKHEIGGRKVHAVLVTHGHGDHVGGLAELGEVPVYAAGPDIALAKGERQPRGFMARAFSAIFGQVPGTVSWQEATGGHELRIDGQRFHVVSIPGHTDGSLAYLWEDVIFTGDAVLGGDPLALAPTSLADDPEQAKKSVEKLLPLDFDAIADGHVGVTTTARRAMFRLAGETLVDPTVSVRTRGALGEGADKTVELVGTWITTPLPDVRGEQPTYLVLLDGQRWRVVNAPALQPEYEGQRVTVRGRRVEGSGGPGIPLEVESVAVAPDGAPAQDTLQGKVGQWVTLKGTVSRFLPLAEGAAWGEGAFSVEGGPELVLAAPVAVVSADGPATLYGQLSRPARRPPPRGSPAPASEEPLRFIVHRVEPAQAP